MNRNITILVIILVILLIAGYLLWLRGRFPTTKAIPTPSPVVNVVPSPTLAPIATTSATASVSGTPKITPKVSTGSGKVVK